MIVYKNNFILKIMERSGKSKERKSKVLGESGEQIVKCKSIQEAFKLAFVKYDKHIHPHNKKPNKFLIRKGRLYNQKDNIIGFETKKDDIKETWCCFRIDFDPIKKTHINFSTMEERFAFEFDSEENFFVNLMTELTDNFSNSEDAIEIIKRLRSHCY